MQISTCIFGPWWGVLCIALSLVLVLGQKQREALTNDSSPCHQFKSVSQSMSCNQPAIGSLPFYRIH